MINIAFSCITAFIITFLAIPSIIKVAVIKNLFDEPGERKAHKSSIPTLGGLAIFAGVVFSFTFWSAEFNFQSTQYIIADINVYVQAMLDEFKISEVRSGNGWWGNKQAFQVGAKATNFLIKNINVLTEFNYVRPFTYSHRSTLTNYAHFNQSLAHPSGSNFFETVSILNYSYKNLYVKGQFNYIVFGTDTGKSNLGSDIFKSYDIHTLEYENKITQGLKHNLAYANFKLGYLVNPATNFVLEGGLTLRQDKPTGTEAQKTIMITFGIRTGITNRYLDF
jgi:hypothetical protein